MNELPLILEPEILAQSLEQYDNLLIVDLSGPEHYAQAHIPGAVHVHPAETRGASSPVPGLLPEPGELEALLGRIGLTPERHVVAYDDEGGGWAGRLLWLLDCVGHDRFSLLNGGRIAWVEEGYPTTTEIPSPRKTRPTIRIQSGPTADMDEVLAAIDVGGITIWDARSPEEYQGRRQSAARNGHIPGAVNLEWTELMDPDRNYRLLPEDQLRSRLRERGIDPGTGVITHCQSHHRSGLTYVVAKALGFPGVRAYAGSWAEWGNHPETPIE